MNNTINTSILTANKILKKSEILANNLANVSTSGFKSQLRTILNSPINDGKITKSNSYSFLSNIPKYDFSNGFIRDTHDPLNLAIKNAGWFVVKDNKNKELYTRNGKLEINNLGQLTINQCKVIDKNGKFIYIPINCIPTFSTDGTITITSYNNNKKHKQKIGKIKIININVSKIKKNKNGFFQLEEKINKNKKDVFIKNKDAKIIQGALEDSNVNLTENLVEMIDNTRQFEMQMKMINLCNENEQKANSILNTTNNY
ncbi:Flagellar basal-body rod protein FlgF [Buchnera aphidicola (Tetraneura ulmi)]|uniref:flagellar basal body rod protein FlgF n=1 Tax=Buchnera aphidicola TaxID=9 RepID=UPI0034648763